MKKQVKDWNKNVNGDINEKIAGLEKQQFLADEEGLSDMDRTRVNQELDAMYNTRAQMPYQKSRARWNIEGDRNSRFFHRWAKYRWNKS